MITFRKLVTEQDEQQVALRRRPFVSARLLMSLFIFFAVVMMGMRVQDVALGLARGTQPNPITPAEAKSDAHVDAKKEEIKPEVKAKEKPVTKPEDAGAHGQGHDNMQQPVANADAGEEEGVSGEKDSFTDAEVNILKRLSERRQELDKQGRDIEQREALIKITEQRIDKKLADIKTLEEQVKQMVSVASAEEKAKADSLVKIYEIMKPKEAARIFDALDMSTLLRVISRMKESKVAPILAAMDANKAKQVTAALMEKKQLPQLP